MNHHTINIIESLAQFILMIITLSIGLKYFKTLKELNHFFLVPLMGIIQYIYTSIAKFYLNEKTFIEVLQIIISIYVVVEFIVFIYFFQSHTRNHSIKNILTLISIIFLTYFILNEIIEPNYISKLYYLFCAIESFIIISFALNLFVQLIFDDEIKDFKTSPVFLINTSLFFFFTYTFPFYFFDLFLKNEPSEFFILNKTINGLAYFIFYLMLIKSLRCKIKLGT